MLLSEGFFLDIYFKNFEMLGWLLEEYFLWEFLSFLRNGLESLRINGYDF